MIRLVWLQKTLNCCISTSLLSLLSPFFLEICSHYHLTAFRETLQSFFKNQLILKALCLFDKIQWIFTQNASSPVHQGSASRKLWLVSGGKSESVWRRKGLCVLDRYCSVSTGPQRPISPLWLLPDQYNQPSLSLLKWGCKCNYNATSKREGVGEGSPGLGRQGI